MPCNGVAGDEHEDGSSGGGEDSRPVQQRRPGPGRERVPSTGHRRQRLCSGPPQRELSVRPMLKLTSNEELILAESLFMLLKNKLSQRSE